MDNFLQAVKGTSECEILRIKLYSCGVGSIVTAYFGTSSGNRGTMSVATEGTRVQNEKMCTSKGFR